MDRDFFTIFALGLKYTPMGLIGLWRWSVWTYKKFISLFYRNYESNFSSTLSIITPVYNEDPVIFKKALYSWINEKPDEIIAVIDYTDIKCIQVYKKLKKKYPQLKLMVTRKPGKRQALYDGIKMSKYEIIALVDSDTIWEKDIKQKLFSPFANPKIGGVSTRQSVYKPSSITAKLFDLDLDLRYLNDYRFLSFTSNILYCLSGRTALYRREALVEVKDILINETFNNNKVISGDDKSLTLQIQNKWHAYHQEKARVYTAPLDNYIKYVNQRVRWSRNSWRYHFRFIKQAYKTKNYYFLFYLLDKTIQPFVLMYGFICFFYSIFSNNTLLITIFLLWWLFSRILKVLSHFREKPKDLLIAPFFMLSNYISGIISIYSLFTINTHNWTTRWGNNRNLSTPLHQKIIALTATLIILILLVLIGFVKS